MTMGIITHGMSKTPEHRIWIDMRRRCLNPKNGRFHKYGGRGIGICARWSNFENFLADMGTRPGVSFSLDRLDTNGDYEPGNCKWSTPTEQQRNKREQVNNSSGVTGVHFNQKRDKWETQIKVAGKRIFLGYFVTIEDAAAARKVALDKYGFQPEHGAV